MMLSGASSYARTKKYNSSSEYRTRNSVRKDGSASFSGAHSRNPLTSWASAHARSDAMPSICIVASVHAAIAVVTATPVSVIAPPESSWAATSAAPGTAAIAIATVHLVATARTRAPKPDIPRTPIPVRIRIRIPTPPKNDPVTSLDGGTVLQVAEQWFASSRPTKSAPNPATAAAGCPRASCTTASSCRRGRNTGSARAPGSARWRGAWRVRAASPGP